MATSSELACRLRLFSPGSKKGRSRQTSVRSGQRHCDPPEQNIEVLAAFERLPIRKGLGSAWSPWGNEFKSVTVKLVNVQLGLAFQSLGSSCGLGKRQVQALGVLRRVDGERRHRGKGCVRVRGNRREFLLVELEDELAVHLSDPGSV